MVIERVRNFGEENRRRKESERFIKTDTFAAYIDIKESDLIKDGNPSEFRIPKEWIDPIVFLNAFDDVENEDE
ncbi:hypothetical protein FACS1894188_09050 [Clostridia bacterium]|nr:hypothetical protein FACS1894188_09050 [Clostridia bacterium]